MPSKLCIIDFVDHRYGYHHVYTHVITVTPIRKTSDLIPLCHPLPLDKVHIDIQLVDNRAIIDCECKVTHKTGVEMEVSTSSR